MITVLEKSYNKKCDTNIYLDGLFTVILECEIRKDVEAVKYGFRTKSDGASTCKSPAGMFEEDFIPNDMGYVLEKMHEYYYG